MNRSYLIAKLLLTILGLFSYVYVVVNKVSIDLPSVILIVLAIFHEL